MNKPEVSVHLVVYNGERYLRRCLEAIKAQTYENIKFRIFNNASTDNTIAILREVWPSAELINFDKNHSLGGGFNRSLYYSDSPYVVGLCVDVAMASDFIERAVDVVERYKKIGVLQAKIYRYDWEKNENTNIIDTTGIQIFRSRRITNRGHGEQDTGQYNVAGGIFCYEGAVPLFRREALDDASVLKDKKDDKYPYEYLDEDFVWYADELDLGWRMRLLGWENWYEPSVIAYHDRQTTHKLSHSYRDFIRLRRTVPAFKRRLDFENQRLAFIKNDFGVSILMNLPWFLKRELFLFVYFLIWERSTVPAYWHIIKKTPLMLHKRKKIMKRRKISKGELRRWFK
ncbi:MAG: hypothetical protein A3F94_00945 [Candidatus Spechtbacteria bacterium RIFCSPLOWO2_12_FULL_38_22]|uniref:Glycosyltransferase 2-like domain-containing protein n=1 Tax=Candidatus Spechtbacteria bacterium RIFCSPLOWO2_12_FULL_38_22 TaxID=1802165 RepID=A0A1G2HGY0_9BACT|nr:MAG: hypothetical protein A2728_01835 [Candidatus Spechtbacteria bacterium RIFCSPHIGHO2_01_FULL_38_11]OGZ59473.1 MAG: hypothetical protein A3E58_00830 [Candidatus Spechtbacteria bacterium RIFCSPHIGHO2_12_FULL_38_30]OGZ59920.1 MAG: hypothetical protein A3A00_00905 [Candidatus Spechtbacteria bacterium RIFCSPLOWO2_01_FULL_38_20]OGZ61747.1 MAG: hypothetical protein A3F94_00945 [Candidatus Spechtbacteria bacterium RIFCSPLOWO2_12_FULL_38_22]